LQLLLQINGNKNEKTLFRGISNSQQSIDGIINNGFDNRFWNTGLLGIGAYFADDVRISSI